MSYKVIMSRCDEAGILKLRKEYITEIPLKVIMQLAHIEKRDWPLFRDSPYHMFGRFVYHRLSHYPQLIPYITKQNCNFEFIYEYITDQTTPVYTKYYHNGSEISHEQYLLHTQNTYYFERWSMSALHSHASFIFFECEYTPTPLASI